jgi:RimJ/RimL family protein N-acetyltransferase
MGSDYQLDAPIATERLRLRLFTTDDAAAVYAIRSQPEVALFLYGDPWIGARPSAR